MRTLHTPPKGQTPQRCATLTVPQGPGTIRFAEVSVATAQRAYGHYAGVNDFLRTIGSGSVVFCSLDNPATSLHGCKSGRTMFLVTTRGPSKLMLPCGAEPGIPR